MQVRFLSVAAAATVLVCGTGGRTRAQELGSCTSSIRVLINRYATNEIPSGNALWFSGVLQRVQSARADLKTAPVRIDVRHARVAFGKWPYIVALPDSTIYLDPSATNPQRWWVNRSAWSVTFAPSRVPEAFFDGAPFTAPEPLIPGDSGPMTWTATFTASRPGITLTWAWSAAVYSRFGSNGRLLVKPLSAPVGEPQPSMYRNDDPAGTPELYKEYVLPGAMGSGAPHYTGARSDAATVQPCVSVQPPPRSSTAASVARSHPIVRTLRDYTSGECYTGDLCARVGYPDGDRVAIYSEGAARCDGYRLYFTRSSGGQIVFAFSRKIASLCGDATARLSMDGGRVRFTISKNANGSLKFVVST